MEANKDELPVIVYYCPCGMSIECASQPSLLERDRAVKKEFKQAKDWGRKVETITLAEYRKIPFMCSGNPKGCVKNNTSH